MNDKQQLLTTLREEFHRWEELLARMSEEQIMAPYAPQKPYNKSVRDVIAHLRAWQQTSIARLEAAHLHRDPKFPGWPVDFESDSEDALDRTNAWIYETSREQPWPRVHREWREGFLRLLELGEALPEKDLMDAGRYSWLEGQPLSLVLLSSYEHHNKTFRGRGQGDPFAFRESSSICFSLCSESAQSCPKVHVRVDYLSCDYIP